jgi:hypothetical protein
MYGVRLQVTAFRPFVPAVDVYDAWTFDLCQQTLPRQHQGLPKPFGRVATDGVRHSQILVSAWRTVPAHRHIREIRDVEPALSLVPISEILIADVVIVGLKRTQRGMMDPDIRGYRIEAQIVNEFCNIGRCLFKRQHGLAPYHSVKVQPGNPALTARARNPPALDLARPGGNMPTLLV